MIFNDIIGQATWDANNEVRVLVCGSRDFDGNAYTKQQVFDTLDRLSVGYLKNKQITVINGWANGVDLAAAEWAESRYLPFLSVPADWGKYKKIAGFYRNERMLTIGKPNIVIAFPGGRGTNDMITRAKRRGIEVIEIEYEQPPKNP